jgi:hypothetical protein
MSFFPAFSAVSRCNLTLSGSNHRVFRPSRRSFYTSIVFSKEGGTLWQKQRPDHPDPSPRRRATS